VSVHREPFGTTTAGVEVERVVLDSGQARLSVLGWGACVQALEVPDRRGRLGDVVLGFDTLAGYEGDDAFLGAVVGRYANRIAHGRFTLDGQEHQVPTNDRGHALHGGPDGFHRHVWQVVELADEGSPAVTLRHVSPDGDMGFPGRLEATVTYRLAGSEVQIDYRAVTDRPTVVSLTQHTYFNLAGPGSGPVEDHVLTVAADGYLPVDDTGIPTGGPVPVQGTVFDFRSGKRVGDNVRRADPELLPARGFDHALVLAEGSGPAVRLVEPRSGRVLELLTDRPALQLYTGNQLDGTSVGKAGLCHRQGDGMCLETQALPDSPNHPEFPSVVLRPGEEWRSTTVWRFSAT
jgi:aldose 1-epimerase